MKQQFFRILPVLFLFCGLHAVEIKNPGFETGNKSFEGVGWWWFSSADSCDFDTDVKYSGKRSIRLTVNDKTKWKQSPHWTRAATLLGPVHGAKPDTIYTLRCRIRTDMKEGSVGVAVLPNRKKMTMTDRVPVKFMPVTKTLPEWTELVYTFKTPEDMTNLTIFAAAENFTGSAWFDDFSIEEGGDMPRVPASDSFDNSLTLNNFILTGDKAPSRAPAKEQTEIKLISSGRNLILRGTCMEPQISRIRTKAAGRDGAVWEDDSVEIFLDAQRSRSTYYQFIVNADGALYDAHGSDKSWSPKEIRLKTERGKDRWTFELTIPYTAIGYGNVEAALPDKQMGLAVFRTRRTEDQMERSAWQIWPIDGNFGNPANFQAIQVGSGNKGSSYHFLTRGYESVAMRPPLAWQTDDPLYEELMTDVPMHKPGTTIGFCALGGMMSFLSPGATAFALQHGMKYHYSEVVDLTRKMRTVMNAVCTPVGGIDPARKSLYSRLQEKYNLKLSVNPMIQFGGRWYAYSHQPQAPMFKHFAGAYFYPDSRVQESFAKHVKELLTNHKDRIDELVLGHEGRFLYFSPEYDHIRASYLKNDPEAWKRFEEQAKKEYGSGKIGFPKSHASATPLERMVYQCFVFTEYNRGIRKLAKELRGIKPEIRLISELDPDGVKPYFYEQSVGTYDYMCQQMPWGHGANRQSVGFNCKILTDLAETPARGGAHIEHYFVSLSPEEVNEVLSSVFRTGGEALQLWLIDWFGKTMSDYYGSPERLHEIVNIYERYGTMRKLKFPEADTAILYSNLSQCARGWAKTGGIGGGHEEAFTVLGPSVRSWFRFLSDTQIQLGRRKFSEFKVIYDPGAEYFDEGVYRKLVEYVENGGTLVVADPLSFRFRTDGTERDTSPLLGVKVGEELKHQGAIQFRPLDGFPKTSAAGTLNSGAGRKLIPDKNTGILGAYADGTPALTVHRLGKGRVLTFAATPFTSSMYGSVPWKNLFRSLQLDLGCAVDRDIWRFKFPMAKQKPAPRTPEEMQCLTGNSWYWVSEHPTEGPNARRNIQVDYSPAPDHIPDTSHISKLFNRKESLTAQPLNSATVLDGKVDPWVVAWKKGAPALITLKFDRKVTTKLLKLWVHGDIPHIEFGTVENGAFRRIAAANPPEQETIDVREIELAFPPVTAEQFAIRLGERKHGTLYLGEIELWGKQ